jgi:hypothetical protein
MLTATIAYTTYGKSGTVPRAAKGITAFGSELELQPEDRAAIGVE